MNASKNPVLAVTSTTLDRHLGAFELAHLSGRGVLDGRYVSVRNGLSCNQAYGAFAEDQKFLFSSKQQQFQEAMSYAYADRYRAYLDGLQILKPLQSIRVIAACMKQDNAYYWRSLGFPGTSSHTVCMGESVATPGAAYAHDAAVLVHELQHASTVETYSATEELNRFWYDEAGALNEGISDFMALAFLKPEIDLAFDPRVFSRWALGLFTPNFRAQRGVHRCPQYDPDYPRCSGYRVGAEGFSADLGRVSFSYPDGLGWSFPSQWGSPGKLRAQFLDSTQEEIHNNGVILSGALWDVFEVWTQLRGESWARDQSARMIHRALPLLPYPSISARSPVRFRNFALALVQASLALGTPSGEHSALVQALENRGLIGGFGPSSGWAQVGAGLSATPGLRVLDHPSTLKSWLRRMGVGNPDAIVQQGISTGLDGRAQAGETLAVWFDLKNVSEHSAGGVQLDVRSRSASVRFLGYALNDGYINDAQAQIQYAKINGTRIVSALASSDSSKHVPTGNSYFSTHPFFDSSWKTALWIQIAPDAVRGERLEFEITATPSNGLAESVVFSLEVAP
jgi:hypothetical protein